MSYYPGYVDSAGRTYKRCRHCGDSDKNPKHAHGFIDKHGTEGCWRCGIQVRLTIRQVLEVTLGLASIEEVTEPDWIPYNRRNKIKPARHTLLTVYEADDPQADAFAMRDKHGKLIGWQTRLPDSKLIINEGSRGINWYGADNGRPLISTSSSPKTLVEGGYDVVKDDYVTGFGSFGTNTFKHLKGQHIIAFPDPDVINDSDPVEARKKQKAFVELMQMANENYCWVHGIISANADPDKATETLYIPLKRAIEYVRSESYA